MHAMFVLNCWVEMNCTQSTNLQLCSNQSTGQPQLLVWGERAPKSTFVQSPHICRSVPSSNPKTQSISEILLS